VGATGGGNRSTVRRSSQSESESMPRSIADGAEIDGAEAKPCMMPASPDDSIGGAGDGWQLLDLEAEITSFFPRNTPSVSQQLPFIVSAS
jgi:hypothetical protein